MLKSSVMTCAIVIALQATSAMAAPPAAQPSAAAKPATPAKAVEAPRRADLVRNLEARFSAIDTNRDGVVTADELTGSYVSMAGKMEAAAVARRNAAFDRLDKDHDGKISREEWAAIPAGPKVTTGNAAADVARLDGNGDKRISLSEFSAKALSGFDKADTNKDGVLQDAEIRAARAARAPK